MTKKTKRLLLSILCFTLILGYAIWYTYYAKPEQKEKIDSLTRTEQTAPSNKKSSAGVENTRTDENSAQKKLHQNQPKPKNQARLNTLPKNATQATRKIIPFILETLPTQKLIYL